MNAWSIIQLYMFNLKIKSIEELAEKTGISYGTLVKRKGQPGSFKMYELIQIANVLDMTTVDWQMLCTCLRAA